MAGVRRTVEIQVDGENVSPTNPLPVDIVQLTPDTVTANQGTPNAGGADAWPVTIAGDEPVDVEGTGTPGTPAGGVLTVQGDPGGEPVPVVTQEPITVDQGAPAAVADAWPVKVTDGVDVADVATSTPPSTAPGLVARTIAEKSGTSVRTNVVAAAATDVELLAAGARLGFAAHNDTNRTMNLAYGTGASATSFTVPVPPGGTWTDPFRSVDAIHAFWPAGVVGSARMTEVKL